jgi:hypothetical protein
MIYTNSRILMGDLGMQVGDRVFWGGTFLVSFDSPGSIRKERVDDQQ